MEVDSKKPSLSDEICKALKEDIYSGRLPAGSPIDLQSLMNRFSVSRTPVREAVQTLVSLGYLVLVPRHGAVVKSLTAAEYIAMLEVLIQLESLAASLSARRMPSAVRTRMKEALAACEIACAQGDHATYAQANRQFHETLYEGCLNAYLAEQVRELRIRMRHPRKDTFEIPQMMRHSMLGHQAIYEAIMAGDEQAAAAAMTAHIASGGNVYSDAIARLG